jgi:L-aminopeptidase/D-esterase-like protein
VVVAALVVVNCVGDVIDPSSGKRIAGIYDREKRELLSTMEILKRGGGIPAIGAGNTTIGVVATNAALTKAQAKKVAEMAHDGYARAIDPIHTMHDGDTIFSLSTGTIEADVTVIGALGADVMAKACIDAVCSAKTVVGLPAVSEISQPKQEKLENGV